MDLPVIWFGLVAVLWVGYLVLEGFDFGVGMLLHTLPRDRRERRVMINTVGPVFDGNEVWLITAAGAMFAAFPEWYATTFSAYYLPLLLVLVALIVRNVGFEFRHKRPDLAWQRRWEWAIAAGSVVPAVVWGVLLAGLVGGIPIDADAVYVGGLAELFTPYALLGGLVTSTLFLTHGALFTALKTVGPLRHRARALALRLGAVAGTSLTALVLWTSMAHSDTVLTLVTGGLSVAALSLGLLAAWLGREGWAFTGTSVAVAALVGTLYVTLFPNVVVSSLDPAWNLTIADASSTPYTLTIMTVVSVVALPVIIGYQAWTYWVFRKRLGTHHMPDDELVAAGRGA
ncbi:cytochrome d ubiquinol oxidase subunit II [Auraticoccus monumenti]|uniref:Cytochrome bd-I ubiquinol oxidase subunit 2 apoprotein n=1 Tax=Auraticoccus monumenti TaxID=675864 RepID=A0A1G6TYB8_9ACTN|nr:cytochrome d ubiquinol oxidase subunit II [Auraticoccus monumenti]SDD34051.1 cytochrome bd-I ubiquinol oxidase subunit 2 apoprotein [Auraticoccus monumenti]